MNNWRYRQAYTNLEDPFYACRYDVQTHPKFSKCDECPSFNLCTLAMKEVWLLEKMACGKVKVEELPGGLLHVTIEYEEEKDE